MRYEPGEVKAIAYKKGKQWAEQSVKTTGVPAGLAVQPEKKVLVNDGSDLSFVRIDIVDKEGMTVPRTKNRLKFSVSGPGRNCSNR